MGEQENELNHGFFENLFGPSISQPNSNALANAYISPIQKKRNRAKQYAAEAKARNKPECECETCVRQRNETAVRNILERWQ